MIKARRREKWFNLYKILDHFNECYTRLSNLFAQIRLPMSAEGNYNLLNKPKLIPPNAYSPHLTFDQRKLHFVRLYGKT